MIGIVALVRRPELDGRGARIAHPNSERLLVVERKLAERVQHDLGLWWSHVELGSAPSSHWTYGPAAALEPSIRIMHDRLNFMYLPSCQLSNGSRVG